jgi:hypothetical protein
MTSIESNFSDRQLPSGSLLYQQVKAQTLYTPQVRRRQTRGRQLQYGPRLYMHLLCR